MKKFMKPIAYLVLGVMFGGIALAGLETVTHIQDLNSSWPLGSDLASTSDDHIRNIKSALKTDFPNFNGTYTSAALPVFAIPSDTNTGMYSVGADDLGFTTGGTLRFDISTTAMTATLPALGPGGSAAAPTWSFSGDSNTGAYSVGADDWGVTTGGTLRFDISTTAVTSTLVVRGPDGVNTAPAFAFTNDTDTGIYRAANNTGALSAAGGATFVWSTQGFGPNVDGTAASPAIYWNTDTDTGFYRDTANQIGIALGGSTAGQIAQGSFSGTITGCTTSPSSTIVWQRVGNLVMLSIDILTATSNATTFTITGFPAAITPATTTTGRAPIIATEDSGTRLFSSEFTVNTSGVMTLYTSGSSTGWTAAGVKGIPVLTQAFYWLP